MSYMKATVSSSQKLHTTGKLPLSPRNREETADCKKCQHWRNENLALEQKVKELTRLAQALQQTVERLEGTGKSKVGAGVVKDKDGTGASADGGKPSQDEMQDYEKSVDALIRAQSLIRGFLIRKRLRKCVRMYGGSEMAKPLRQRNKIVLEIQSSEQAYLKGLEDIVLLYLTPLTELLPQNLIERVFSNIGLLVSIHREFFRKISIKVDQLPLPMNLGELFLELRPKLEAYKLYTERYSVATIALTEIANDHPQLATKLMGKENWKSNLANLLITPIQRIPRYVLLLKELLKFTDGEHREQQSLLEALLGIQSVADEINEHQRATEGRVRVHEVVDKFTNLTQKTLMPIVRSGWIKLRETVALGITHTWTRKFFILRGGVLFCFKKEVEDLGLHDWEKKALWSASMVEHFVMDGRMEGGRAIKEEKKDPSVSLQFALFENKEKTKQKYRLAAETKWETDLWLEALKNGQTALELGLYTDLLAKHRLVVKEGPLAVIAQASDPEQLTRTQTSGGVPYVFLFNDLILCCSQNRNTGNFTINEVIHIPSIVLVVACDDPKNTSAPGKAHHLLHGKDESAAQQRKEESSTRKEESTSRSVRPKEIEDEADKLSFIIQTQLVMREFRAKTKEDRDKWLSNVLKCWNRFNDALKIHEGARQVTVANSMADLKRQIERRDNERAYYQTKMGELIDTLYKEESALGRHRWELKLLDQRMEHRQTVVADDDVDQAGRRRDMLESAIIHAERKVDEAEQETERMMELLTNVNQKLSQLLRERDEWAQYLELTIASPK